MSKTRSTKKSTIKLGFADFWHGNTEAELRTNPFYQLLAPHFAIELSDEPDFLFYSCFGKQYLKYDCTRIFYAGENVRPDFNECDYAFSFDYPVTTRNYRLPLYHLYGYTQKLRECNATVPDPAGREFCNFVYSNKKARERIQFLKLLNRHKRVDCGGKIMNNIGARVDDKLAFLSNYKFTIAFENSNYPGYTTEKIVEPLLARSIPIYWGNPDVVQDFNPDCFINCHSFNSFEAVIEHVMAVDADDSLYRRYLLAPVFANGVDNEFINTGNLNRQFERIFSGPSHSQVAGRYDQLKYWLHPARPYHFITRKAREYQRKE